MHIDRHFRDDALLVTPRGVLDLASYQRLRETLVQCAVELPSAVIVDVGGLRVPAEATLTVFTSVWMQLSDWPGVPIVLVAARELDRRRLARSPVTQSVSVHPSVDEALMSLPEPRPRRLANLELPNDPGSVAVARRFVQVTCDRWPCATVARDAVLIASELVENAVRHAHSDPRLRVELGGGMLIIAVFDDDPTPPQLVQPTRAAIGHLGLVLVDRLAGTWSSAPTLSGGKVVWAVLRLP